MMGKIVILISLIVLLFVLLGVRNFVEEMEFPDLGQEISSNILSDVPSHNSGSGAGGSQDYDLPHGWTPEPTSTASRQPSNQPTAEMTEAYNDYIEAYNELTAIMSAGEGDTPEADQAYQEYVTAKEKYEELAKALK